MLQNFDSDQNSEQDWSGVPKFNSFFFLLRQVVSKSIWETVIKSMVSFENQENLTCTSNASFDCEWVGDHGDHYGVHGDHYGVHGDRYGVHGDHGETKSDHGDGRRGDGDRHDDDGGRRRGRGDGR